MGTWGTSLYANDTTSDVRDTYMNYLKDQLSNEEAINRTISDFQELIGDADEEPLFWYALAETQWKVGRLTPNVKGKALDWIEKEGGIALWEESDSGGVGWKKTLDKLKDTLALPVCPEKKIRKPRDVNKSLWNMGDTYAYQFHREDSRKNGTYGKYIIIQKAGEGKYTSKWMSEKDIQQEPLLMRVHLFDKIYDEKPVLSNIRDLRLLPFGQQGERLVMSRLMDYRKKSDYPSEHLHFLGNMPIAMSKVVEPQGVPALWVLLEDMFDELALRWGNRDYEILEDGAFVLKKE